MTNKLAVRVFKQVSEEMIMRSWGHKLLHYQIIICITLWTMSSDNSDDDNDDNNDNHGVLTSRDRLGGNGSLDDNDNYTDRLLTWKPTAQFGSKDEQETRANAHGKRVRDLEYDLRQLEVENKQLKVELKCSKKSTNVQVRRISEPIMSGHLTRQTWPIK